MDCADTRLRMLDARRGRLRSDAAADVRAHLATCAECRALDAADAALSGALDKVSATKAPRALVASLESKWAPPSSPRAARPLFVALTTIVACAAALVFYVARASRYAAPSPLVVEAVNDHLRVLYAERPIEIASGGIHQVKPWFAGRLDFAPIMPFGGDDDFPLDGGSVAYFVDRKAAAFVFKRRLHVITAFVFRADGLVFPASTRKIGHALVTDQTTRGFHALVWRDGDLGYAVVSDVDPKELEALVGRIAP